MLYIETFTVYILQKSQRHLNKQSSVIRDARFSRPELSHLTLLYTTLFELVLEEANCSAGETSERNSSRIRL